MFQRLTLAALFVTAAAIFAQDSRAADKLPTEDTYYKLLTYPIPEGVVLEAGSSEQLPDGRLAVSSRRGEIYLVDQAFTGDPKEAKFTLFAQGLHEVLGLAQRDGWLYVTQR